MKWDLNYIRKNAKPSFTFNEDIVLDKEMLKKLNGVYDLTNININGTLKYMDSISQCLVELTVKGIMKMKCSISNDDVDYQFEDTDSISFSFEKGDDDSEIYLAKGNVVDLSPFIWQLIVVNVPLKVIKDGAKLTNIKGKNWKIGDFEEKNEQDERPIDPRLESLKNYFDK